MPLSRNRNIQVATRYEFIFTDSFSFKSKKETKREKNSFFQIYATLYLSYVYMWEAREVNFLTLKMYLSYFFVSSQKNKKIESIIISYFSVTWKNVTHLSCHKQKNWAGVSFTNPFVQSTIRHKVWPTK